MITSREDDDSRTVILSENDSDTEDLEDEKKLLVGRSPDCDVCIDNESQVLKRSSENETIYTERNAKTLKPETNNFNDSTDPYSSDEDIIRSSQPNPNKKMRESQTFFFKDKSFKSSQNDNFTSTPIESDNDKNIQFDFCANTLEIPGEFDDEDNPKIPSEGQKSSQNVDIFASTQIIEDTPMKQDRKDTKFCDPLACTQVFESTPIKTKQKVDLVASTQLINSSINIEPFASTQIISADPTVQQNSSNSSADTLPFDNTPSPELFDPLACTQLISNNNRPKSKLAAFSDDTLPLCPETSNEVDPFAPTQAISRTSRKEKYMATQLISGNSPSRSLDNNAATQIISDEPPSRPVDLIAPTQLVSENSPSPSVDLNAATQVVSNTNKLSGSQRNNCDNSEENDQLEDTVAFEEDTASANDSRLDLFAELEFTHDETRNIKSKSSVTVNPNDSTVLLDFEDRIDPNAKTELINRQRPHKKFTSEHLESTQIINRLPPHEMETVPTETQATQLIDHEKESSQLLNPLMETQIIKQNDSEIPQTVRADNSPKSGSSTELEETQFLSYSDFDGSSPEIGGIRNTTRYEKQLGESLQNASKPADTLISSQQSVKSALFTATDEPNVNEKSALSENSITSSESNTQKLFRILDSDDEDYKEESKAFVESITPKTKEPREENDSDTEIESNGSCPANEDDSATEIDEPDHNLTLKESKEDKTRNVNYHEESDTECESMAGDFPELLNENLVNQKEHEGDHGLPGCSKQASIKKTIKAPSEKQDSVSFSQSTIGERTRSSRKKALLSNDQLSEDLSDISVRRSKRVRNSRVASEVEQATVNPSRRSRRPGKNVDQSSESLKIDPIKTKRGSKRKKNVCETTSTESEESTLEHLSSSRKVIKKKDTKPKVGTRFGASYSGEDVRKENRKYSLRKNLLNRDEESSGRSEAGSDSYNLRRSITKQYRILYTGIKDLSAEKIIDRLGGIIASSNGDFTHLITDKIRRTPKFLCAVAKGIPIISNDWIHQSKTVGRFLDCEKFQVKDIEGESRFGFNLQDSLKRAIKRKVFDGMGIYLMKGIIPEPEKCTEIVESGGGKILTDFPTGKSEESIRTVLVCKKEDVSSRLVVRAKKNSVDIVDVEWILSGVLKQELDFKNFSH
ncbi:DgyrCDS2704 [Dimorphilus gyrociliatus]|uniref:PAX-interacting protein 1 n=1 Tax=Dimorphilus gyrociliatus TaxID=2664684 RepID=A0A7I8VCW2_9ANNE|nr:DgyrCDS2704 [Dimorphilus gyrociliatus]